MGLLTLGLSNQLLFEWGENVQGKGLAFLPDINELLNLLLEENRQR